MTKTEVGMQRCEHSKSDPKIKVPAGFQPKTAPGTCGRGLLAADGFNIRTTQPDLRR